MREITKTISATLLDYSELSSEEQELLEAARLARQNAYAPYSHYWVGAAIRSAASGRIYVGCNVEVATYTQTTHAEQAATVAMTTAEGRVKITAIAIVAGPKEKEVVFPYGWSAPADCPIEKLHVPCGHCLQIIWEFCFGDPNVVLLGGPLEGGGIARVRIGDAFPMRFGPENLGIKHTERTGSRPPISPTYYCGGPPTVVCAECGKQYSDAQDLWTRVQRALRETLSLLQQLRP